MSINLNLTVHSSSIEWLVIIHGEIKVLMLLVKKKKKSREVKNEGQNRKTKKEN